MRRSIICGVVGVWVAIASTAWGQSEQSAVFLAEQPRKEEEAFAKGSWVVQVWGSYLDTDHISADEGSGGTVNLGAGYYFLDRVGIYGELVGYKLYENDHEESDAYGAGLSLLLRWHFLQIDRFSLFLDGGAGIAALDNDFPSDGTAFNFVERVGLGATYRLKEDLHLMGGVHWIHLSNAGIEGRDRNPGFDAWEYFAGLMFTF